MNDSNSKPDLASLKIDRDKKYNDRPRSRKWLWLLWVVILTAVAFGYFYLKDSVASSAAVRVTRVEMIGGSEANAALVATGYVVAQRKAEVASKGTGRLVFLGFEEGDRVKAGQVIAQIDNDDIKAGLELARAQQEQAEVDTLDAGRQYRRQTELFASGAVTDVEVEAAETRYRNAQAQVRAAAASVRVAEVNVENTYIRAPFDGTVLTKNADIGEVVAPFASSSSSKGSVVTLADMNSLEVEADVSESNIYKVAVGQRCEIVLDAYPQVRYPGYVKKIVPTADRSRATVLTKIAFDSCDSRVLPEMSARVNFLLVEQSTSEREPTALVLDKDAVTGREGASFVFRVDGDTVGQISVTLGRDLDKKVEILDGLRAGDRIVLSPPGKMQSGQKVEIIP
ncbi:MAG: efflux RND transporter periplasmic adaptor subunit [candidate division Zixibacteria bacterium]|nr:efflux RND transporter periplasmic adaptor subunit [candidate division Zixibacteria bacterium]